MRDLEQQILAVLEKELRRFGPALARVGYSHRDPEIEVWQSEPKRYTSEIRLVSRRTRKDSRLAMRGGQRGWVVVAMGGRVDELYLIKR